MKSQTVLLENIGRDVADTVFSKTFMNTVAVKKRVQNTSLLENNGAFHYVKWEKEDDQLPIKWLFAQTMLGEVLVAATRKGVCYVGFTNGEQTKALADLERRFILNPKVEGSSEMHYQALDRMNGPGLELEIHLHLQGSDFQLGIWEKLMLVPFGGLITYLELAGDAKKARAVGAAVGANPICFILPCHRVVRSDGGFDGYYWGTELKRRLLTYEAAVSINLIIDTELSKNDFVKLPNQN